MTSDLALAHTLCDAADAITTDRFRAHDLRVETKPDLTPVSEADRTVEEMIRDRLAAERPDDAILGEELGTSGTAERRWIVDPIDGTKSYVRGVPVWATLLALEVAGEPVVGVVSAPALGRRWWGARGGGAFADGDPIHVSEIHAVGDAQVCFDNVRDWEPEGLDARVLELTRSAWRSRAYGDFWGHMLVAEGAAEIMIEPELAYWDVAALRPIIEEAGGRCSSRAGGPPVGPGGCVTTNAHLHDEVLALLAKTEGDR
ncbi:MAG TPA: histidinol-phosphatase [Acidimicrobiia bacterium]|nr:histidinol-phosphatase [Acidimicrobiia bacterium]